LVGIKELLEVLLLSLLFIDLKRVNETDETDETDELGNISIIHKKSIFYIIRKINKSTNKNKK